MPLDMPDWLIEKYTLPSPPAQQVGAPSPAPKGRSSFLVDLKVGDTQQERERLQGATLSSVREKLDPIVLERLANRFKPTGDDPNNITLSPDTTPLTQPPVRTATPLPEGKKVFTDPAQWEKLVDQAPEEGKPLSSFNTQFKQARSEGQEAFEYEGDRFITREKGESGEQWAWAVQVRKDRPTLAPALDAVAPILRDAGITPEVSSGERSNLDWSLHEINEATDLRLKNASPEAIEQLKASLPGKPINVSIHGEQGQLWRKGEFEFIIHGTDDIHLHIERDTKATKSALAKHLTTQGKSENISQQGLKDYPELFKRYFPGKGTP